MDKPKTEPWRPDPFHSVMFKTPETPREPMEFLSRSWSVSALEVSKALSPVQLPLSKPPNGGGLPGGGAHGGPVLEDIAGEIEDNAAFSGNPFSFASSETSQMVMERIMSQSVSELSGAEHYNHPANKTLNTQFRPPAMAGGSTVTEAGGGGGKTGKGRRKVEIKKVEESRKRLVTFSKRKLGLFRKAAELSLLCKSEIAVVVFSQQGKVFSSGYPNLESIITRYLSSDTTLVVGHDGNAESSEVSLLRREYEEAMRVLEDEKKLLNAEAEVTAGSGFGDGSWWNRSVGDMGLKEVQEFKERLQQLRLNLVAAAEEKMTTTTIASPVTLPLSTEEDKTTTSSVMATLLPPSEEEDSVFMSILNDDLSVVKNGATWSWDWDSMMSWNDSSSLIWNNDDINDKDS